MTLICSKCGGKINDNLKLCPHCGDVVSVNNKEATELSSGCGYVSFEFGYSTSKNYEKVVSICKNIPTYETAGDYKDMQHKVIIPLTEIELIDSLYDMVKGWTGARVLLNGKAFAKNQLRYSAMWCYRKMRQEPIQEDYCYAVFDYTMRNLWGCRELHMPIRPCGGGWLRYGAFDENMVWHFDKERIGREILSKVSSVGICPALNTNTILGNLASLPDTIDPQKDEKWEYDYELILTESGYRSIAVGVRMARPKFELTIDCDYETLLKIHGDNQQAYYEGKETIIDPFHDVIHKDNVEPQSEPQPKKVPIFRLVLFIIIYSCIFFFISRSP